MLTFRLNGDPINLGQDNNIPLAHESALTVLREQLAKCGTKEGCASGDCGACTIAIRDPASPTSEWQAVNACILPAGQLQGLEVATVEGLATGAELHPVQTALVNQHASQCGFCTPGFVMSLFSLYHSGGVINDSRISSALGGNLCRCTGYRPIRAAALAMRTSEGVVADWITQPAPVVDQGKATGQPPAPQTARGFYRPATLAELMQLQQSLPAPRFIAGGTDLMLEATQRLKDFNQLVDISQVEELRTLTEESDAFVLGAGVTYARLKPVFDRHYPDAGRLLERLGSCQIRNRGTLGGNIANASPIGDTPPILLAMQAHLDVQGPDGSRTLALEDFFLDYRKTALAPREVITHIRLKKLAPDQQLRVWKLSKRRDDDISASLLAVRFSLRAGHLHDVRVALGGMAAIPKRAYQLERVLEGHALNTPLLERVRAALSAEFTPLSDARASSEYRLLATANLFERLRLQLTSTDIATELLDETAD